MNIRFPTWVDLFPGSNVLMLMEPDCRLLDLYPDMRKSSHPYDSFDVIGNDLWQAISALVDQEEDDETLRLLLQDLDEQAKQLEQLNLERKSEPSQPVGA